MVVGRCYLHAVHADEVQIDQVFQQGHHLAAVQACRLGCAGARRKGRVEAVDVQAQVDGRYGLEAVISACRACRRTRQDLETGQEGRAFRSASHSGPLCAKRSNSWLIACDRSDGFCVFSRCRSHAMGNRRFAAS